MTQSTLLQLEALIDTLLEQEIRHSPRSSFILNSDLMALEESEDIQEPSTLLDSTTSYVNLQSLLIENQQKYKADETDKENSLEKSANTVFELISLRFVDKLFTSNAVEDLPELLKHLVYRLRLPMLRLGMFDLKQLCKEESAPLQLLESLLGYSNCWKNENNIGFPTYTKLSQILEFKYTDSSCLAIQFKNALNPIQQIHQNQSKRAKIFEKRLFETEQSKLKTKRAETIVSSVISETLDAFTPAGFIQDFIQKTWKKLLILEFVRHDNKAFYNAIETMNELLVSLCPLEHQLSLPKLIDRLPDLNKRIFHGFKRLHTDDEESSNFISQLELAHIEIISDNQSENQSFDKSALKSPNSGKEEIIRLKPSGIFDSTEPDNEPENSINNKRAGTSSSITNTIIERLIKEVDNQENKISDIISILDFTKAHVTKLNRENYSQVSALNKHFKLNVGDWFKMIENNSSHKLLFIDDFDGNYFFIDSDTKLSLLHPIDEMKQLLHQEKLIKDNKQQLVGNVAQSMLCDLAFINDLKNLVSQEQEMQKIDVEATEEENKTPLAKEKSIAQKAQKSPPPQKTASPKTSHSLPNIKDDKDSDLEKSKDVDIDLLSVGSWVSYKSDNKIVKAKFAARIRSKDCFIFVDRQGKKTLEISSEELQIKIQEKQITLIDQGTTNQVFLESVISKTRTLKNEG